MSGARTREAIALGVEARGLTVVYDDFVAIAECSLDVAPGESFGIVGESGSGKSTVLRALCGLAPLASGNVRLVGMDRATLPRPGSKGFRRHVQMVFQDPYGSLHPRQTVDRILAEPLAIHGIDDAERRIVRALDEVGLSSSLRFRYPHQLSGGQRQRVAIARAMVAEPKLILADEPTANLDSDTAAHILDLLAKLNAETGTTFVFATHDPAVMSRAQRLVRLHDGRISENARALVA
jgi:peptide/nickel transport system ATP-binding protein